MSESSVFFFFSSRRRHTRFDCDWSSDVCSSDLPFEAESAMDVISSHLHDLPEPPSKHRADVPEAIDQLIVAMLAKKPELRPRSEERRVGKECRSRWSPNHYKKKRRKVESS